MSKVSSLVKFTAKPGRRDALADHFAAYVPTALAEPGTEVWTVSVSDAHPDTVWLYEVYSSPEAVQAHSGDEAYQRSFRASSAFVAGPPEQIDLVPVAGAGLRD